MILYRNLVTWEHAYHSDRRFLCSLQVHNVAEGFIFITRQHRCTLYRCGFGPVLAMHALLWMATSDLFTGS